MKRRLSQEVAAWVPVWRGEVPCVLLVVWHSEAQVILLSRVVRHHVPYRRGYLERQVEWALVCLLDRGISLLLQWAHYYWRRLVGLQAALLSGVFNDFCINF